MCLRSIPTFTLNATASYPISFDNPWAGFAATGGNSPFPPFASATYEPPKDAQFITPVTLQGTFSRDFKLGVTQSWNASVEQEFPGNWRCTWPMWAANPTTRLRRWI